MALFQFRFHTGSIKSVDEHEDVEDVEKSFDSILVRLKGHPVHGSTLTFEGFDSILVRLKVYDSIEDLGRIPGFDSILVRLKVS